MKHKVYSIEGRRECYSVDQCLTLNTYTVGELITHLGWFEEDSSIVINNDEGYTYGSISYSSFEEEYDEDSETTVLTIDGRRDGYSIEDVIRDTMTVGDLISQLEGYDEDMYVMLNNDNGYTYGSIDDRSFEKEEYSTISADDDEILTAEEFADWHENVYYREHKEILDKIYNILDEYSEEDDVEIQYDSCPLDVQEEITNLVKQTLKRR